LFVTHRSGKNTGGVVQTPYGVTTNPRAPARWLKLPEVLISIIAFPEVFYNDLSLAKAF